MMDQTTTQDVPFTLEPTPIVVTPTPTERDQRSVASSTTTTRGGGRSHGVICHFCGKKGHKARNCKKVYCDRCGVQGHSGPKCGLPKVAPPTTKPVVSVVKDAAAVAADFGPPVSGPACKGVSVQTEDSAASGADLVELVGFALGELVKRGGSAAAKLHELARKGDIDGEQYAILKMSDADLCSLDFLGLCLDWARNEMAGANWMDSNVVRRLKHMWDTSDLAETAVTMGGYAYRLQCWWWILLVGPLPDGAVYGKYAQGLWRGWTRRRRAAVDVFHWLRQLRDNEFGRPKTPLSHAELMAYVLHETSVRTVQARWGYQKMLQYRERLQSGTAPLTGWDWVVSKLGLRSARAIPGTF
jgi:hypothetical protein